MGSLALTFSFSILLIKVLIAKAKIIIRDKIKNIPKYFLF